MNGTVRLIINSNLNSIGVGVERTERYILWIINVNIISGVRVISDACNINRRK